jgi:hypothetical protein
MLRNNSAYHKGIPQIEQTAGQPVIVFEVKVRVCPRCGHHEFRRLPRDGMFERSILSVLGLFPWECRVCQRKMYLRHRGDKRQAE